MRAQRARAPHAPLPQGKMNQGQPAPPAQAPCRSRGASCPSSSTSATTGCASTTSATHFSFGPGTFTRRPQLGRPQHRCNGYEAIQESDIPA